MTSVSCSVNWPWKHAALELLVIWTNKMPLLIKPLWHEISITCSTNDTVTVNITHWMVTKMALQPDLGDTLWNVIIKKIPPLSPSLCRRQLANTDGLITFTECSLIFHFYTCSIQCLKTIPPFVLKQSGVWSLSSIAVVWTVSPLPT